MGVLQKRCGKEKGKRGQNKCNQAEIQISKNLNNAVLATFSYNNQIRVRKIFS